MKKADYVVAGILGVAAVLAVKFYAPQEDHEPLPELPAEPAAPPVAEAPAIRYPLPEQPPAPEQPAPAAATPPPETPAAAAQEAAGEATPAPAPEPPLPPLGDSDAVLKPDLYTLAARQVLDATLNMDRIIRRFVVTVDNLPRRNLLNSKFRSNRSVSGKLQVRQDSHGLYLDEANYARYDVFMDLLTSLDTDRLVTLYLHYYPLMQTAYEDLGYPSAYFNDRLIDVIDQLLATPDVGGRIALLRPHVLYKYADPKLEALSAGQKVLIRIGPHHAARVKAKLRELRRGLAGGN